MRAFKTKAFAKQAKKAGITDQALGEAVSELNRGIHNGSLGNHLYKIRVPLKGRGKRSGARVITGLKKDDMAFLLHCYPKNEKSNITDDEEKSCVAVAKVLLSLSNTQIDYAIQEKELEEIKYEFDFEEYA